VAIGSSAVQIGVLLARQLDELGEWLIDATAFDAAGADALWVDPVVESELDPLSLLAGLAAVTSQSLLVAALPAPDRPLMALARTVATIARLSRGRLALVADPERLAELAVAAPGFEAFHRLQGEPGTFERARPGGKAERWVQTPSPEGRAAWRAALADAAERGARGLLVPAGPRLLDILRNPDDPGDRRDLQLASG
jgi:alkanesulfonate monooxygenase SsuD/methylene tetrahydromethanopterin reductase-like flavin-dependent oxidoreductase (luciferase family)